jgi:iron(III) transport system permease protein
MIAASILAILILTIYPVLALARYAIGGEGSPTIRYFNELFTNDFYAQVLMNTIYLATTSIALSSLLGISFAWILTRTNVLFRSFLETALIVPFFVPPLVGVLSWILLVGPQGLLDFVSRRLFETAVSFPIYSQWGIVLVNALEYVPMIFMFSSNTLKSMDPSLEEASLMSGAGTFQTAIRVTLPVSAPGVLSGIIIAYTLSLGMFAAPLLLGTGKGIFTIATLVYELINHSPPNYAQASALSIWLAVIAVATVLLQRRVLGARKFVTVTGKGFRSHVIDLKTRKYPVSCVCIMFAAINLAPIIALILASLMRYYSFDALLNTLSFTLENYKLILLEYPAAARSIYNSLLLAFSGATLGIALSFMMAFIAVRMKARGSELLDYANFIPLALPTAIFGAGLLEAWIYSPIRLYGTLWILLMGYLGYYNLFGYRAMTSGLAQIHPELEEASTLSGASFLKTLRSIMVPLLKPAILTGWLFLFISMLRDISVSIFVYSFGSEVMSVELLAIWDSGGFAPSAALALVQTGIIFGAVYVMQRILGADISSIV